MGNTKSVNSLGDLIKVKIFCKMMYIDNHSILIIIVSITIPFIANDMQGTSFIKPITFYG